MITILPYSFLNAQDEDEKTEDQNSIPSFNLSAIDILGGFYFVDPMGIQLASTILPFEGTLDIDNYILGTNDLISIKIDALNPVSLRGIVINPQGDITIPITGSINLSGLTIAEAETKVKKAVSEQIKNPEITITIESPRPAIIHVTGGVPHPGKYIVPAQSRIDQAIFSAMTTGERKPSKTLQNSSNFLGNGEFSFRDIIIQRANGSIIKADLITYFRTGNFKSNPFVKDGDLITVNKLSRESPKLSISGGVKSDFEIEFREGDSPKDLLDIAGGFTEEADKSKLIVFRRSVTGLEKIELNSNEWESFKLLPNDRIIAPINRETDRSTSVWVYGEVELPGNFPIINGITSASDILELSGGVTSDALISAAFLVRNNNPKNALPNDFNADLLKRTSDQIVQGLEYLDAESRISQNKVFVDLNDQNQLQNLKLYDGDRLYIPRDQQTVFVFGQVNNPGYFPFIPSDNISAQTFISKAGGFALAADKGRIFVIKVGSSTWYKPSDTEIQSGDKIFIDRQPIEELNALRTFEIQKAQLRNQRTQLFLTAITTVTGIITTYVAIQNLKN